jgi:benzoylformate decarboxylase
MIHITNDPDEVARAPIGDAIVADFASATNALLDAAKPTQRRALSPRAPIPDIEHAQIPLRSEALSTAGTRWRLRTPSTR